MLVRNASPSWPMCFMDLMFSLSGPCELLFLLCFIASWTRVVVIYLYCICCSANGSACLVCCVFDILCELVGETIRNVFGCGCYFVDEKRVNLTAHQRIF